MAVSLDEFMDAFRAGRISVYCDNGTDRAEVIQFLLDHGIPHGGSGWSKKMLADPEADIKESYHWTVVMCSQMSGGIEFSRSRRSSTVSYAEIARLIWSGIDIDVDDLI